ncbi:Armadillo [Corchorus olitorius]|uniref:Armadillo n=1 Tax=Corchorus olitorius TaxID=93759 RepID=A0A1R3JY19_9ROSI|nr:Armadillo [Corchorus olitorius]
MMASTLSTRFNMKLFNPQQEIFTPISSLEAITAIPTKPRRKGSFFSAKFHHLRHHHHLWNSFLKPNSCSVRTVLRNVSGDGNTVDATPQEPAAVSDGVGINIASSTLGDNDVALFVRMLGLDNGPLDREMAIVALWKYALGGKKFVDAIMQFKGCINLTVNLLNSESSAACEAAAGLLRSISFINVYRDLVAESGAIEEITGLLCRPSLTSEVKEQSLCALWNLSVDEKLRVKIANSDILPLLINSLDDEDIKLKEAAGGILANLALSHCNHNIMVEAGVIPKLAKLLKTDEKGTNVIQREARNALLELAKDHYYKILVIEEGLLPVPIVGAAAYKSFKPGLYSWPTMPDGTEIEQTSKGPSRFGASQLLLGLNVDKNVDIDEAKMKAIVGRTQQQFLARIGAIELNDEKKPLTELPTDQRLTLMPWMDGVARLVLILEVDDDVAILSAAESIADSSINEHMRTSFREAGATKHLVRLLDHSSDAVRSAVIHALERLSVSPGVCQVLESEGILHPLISTLKHSKMSESLMEKTLDILARILDPSKEMKSKFYDEPVNGSKNGLDAARSLDTSVGVTGDRPMSVIDSRKELLDSSIITRFIEILRTSPPNLQRKAASIMEFMTLIEPSMETIIRVDISSGLDAVFQQKALKDMEADEGQELDKYALELEEAGLAVSAASRLLTKLLDSEQFCQKIDSAHFTKLLCKILKSNIPLQNKDCVAACLVKLSFLSGPNVDFENPINMEVTLYEAIPRLIEQIKSSFSPEAQEAAVVELNRIISEGVVDSTRAVASEGGIFPLVKLIEEGSERAVEAALSILYNLSMDSENHSAIIAAGAVPALRRIVLSQRANWTRALRLLRNLPAPSVTKTPGISSNSFHSSDLEEQKRRTVFDGLLPLTAGSKHESEIEKKLRETGEFIGSKTEAAFRSSGKTILLVVLQWFLPIWTLSLLVASGAIKLPFNIPQIDDLIM